MKQKINAWMSRNVAGYFKDGEVNLTELSEGCANALGHNEWLDDPDHYVWEAAINAAKRVGGLR